ncbi:MAG: alcohol dehydrogenase catalytic domain-containing protein [Thermomicrobiales bacterium]|nr:alcohol dehydrogenase catalytic domain-containing protein [Thermomicrobiales bacterium]
MSIPETMLAVRTYGPRDYRVEEVPVPKPGPGEVLIEVEACGICASDMKCFTGGDLFWGKDGSGGYVEGPCTAGHEFAGRVVALGEGAGELHDVALGDRVIAEQIVPCGECRFCQRGEYWMCQVHTIFGFKQFANGGMARYSLYPAKSRIHKVPESLSAGETAYIEPAACAWHAVDRGEIKPGDTVVISGVGNIGLCMLQIARMSDPKLVIALDAKPYRLELAKEFGADVTIDVTQEDAVAKVQELTDGYGCDVYIEASGNPASVNQGLQMIRKLGTFVEFSVFNEPATINWTIIGDTKELNIHGSHLGPYCYPKTIAAIADGSLDVKPLLAEAYPVSQFDKAMEASLSGGVLKNLIVPE